MLPKLIPMSESIRIPPLPNFSQANCYWNAMWSLLAGTRIIDKLYQFQDVVSQPYLQHVGEIVNFLRRDNEEKLQHHHVVQGAEWKSILIQFIEFLQTTSDAATYISYINGIQSHEQEDGFDLIMLILSNIIYPDKKTFGSQGCKDLVGKKIECKSFPDDTPNCHEPYSVTLHDYTMHDLQLPPTRFQHVSIQTCLDFELQPTELLDVNEPIYNNEPPWNRLRFRKRQAIHSTILLSSPPFLIFKIPKFLNASSNQPTIIEIDLKLNLPLQNKNKILYTLVGVLLYVSQSIQSGHYVSAFYHNNRWEIHDDAKPIQTMQTDQFLPIAARFATGCIYERTGWMS